MSTESLKSDASGEFKPQNSISASIAKKSDHQPSDNARTSSSSSSSSASSSSRAGPNSKKSIKRRKSFINVAPLNTSLERRLQTLAVAWHTVSIPLFCCLFLLVVYAGIVSWLVIIIPYFIWLYGFDLHTPTNGKVVYRVKDFMRNLILWRWFVDYFPIRVHKTCDLEPTFTNELIEAEPVSDDEQDLVSESSNTVVDDVFRFLRLRKRLNDSDASSAATISKSPEKEGKPSTKHQKFRRVATGPRYIFGYHPHGVISMGVMGLFSTNVLRNEPFQPPFRFLKPLFHDPSKGERTFPGIGYIFPLTLTEQFVIPFFRDYLLSLGLTSASGKNIKSVINNGDNSVCLVVGGAQESLLNDVVGNNHRVGIGYSDSPEKDDFFRTDGGDEKANEKANEKVDSETLSSMAQKQIRLVLHKRKGFVKLAIEMGNISLVPVFAFGEADVYRLSRPPPGSWGYSFQQWMKTNFHFTLPFFSARGVFIYDFGFLPYRTPINIVTGKPIYVPSGLLSDELDEPAPRKQRSSSFTSLLSLKRTKTPTRKRKVPQELLDRYHRMYVEELKRLYEDNKEQFGYGDVELKIIE
ncbi:hypothetical protein JCM33374_g2699 [Metschnikowia sp. JCM 33374]|nr:hypothetical protein JCM33374_g2699 [Metschnikowia sp. JCM 33374]